MPFTRKQVANLTLDDKVRDKVWDPVKRDTVTVFCPIEAIEPGPVSAWLTLRNPLTGGTFRIRPRLSKSVVIEP